MADPQAVRTARRDLGQQLAALRKAKQLSQQDLADQTIYSRSSIANIETGLQPVNRTFWEAVDALLGAEDELVQGYDAIEDLRRAHPRPIRRTRQDPPEDLVAPAAANDPSLPFAMSRSKGTSSSPIEQLAGLSFETPVPKSIDWVDVDHVRFVTRSFAISENTFGGGFSGQAAAAQLRHSSLLLHSRASSEVRLKIFEAVGNLGGVVGFSAFDVGDYNSARKCFDFELWCAENAKSWTLKASALSDMARLAIYLGETDDALSLIELAQVRSDRLTASLRAMLGAMRARLLALHGRHGEALAEIDRSDEQFAAIDRDNEPPWMSYYDEAEHQGSTGRALIPIAMKTGSPALVAARMRRAICLHDKDHPRSRAFSRTRLASLTMKIGNPREAAELGWQSVEDASTVRSSRLRIELERLAAISAPHRKIPEVGDLIQEISVPNQTSLER
ncbi:helix-turn-helix domain-containing protein [Actinoplanes nipponensis]|uniref:helix-turn-helix domain-containing protein n=1 Tax=Actinoplanes nipponensis TaxID=135950 RepID=UPI001941E243|nr:helix-turn-helix transcriptional regulator [Actinoplanes nipponensis]